MKKILVICFFVVFLLFNFVKISYADNFRISVINKEKIIQQCNYMSKMLLGKVDGRYYEFVSMSHVVIDRSPRIAIIQVVLSPSKNKKDGLKRFLLMIGHKHGKWVIVDIVPVSKIWLYFPNYWEEYIKRF